MKFIYKVKYKVRILSTGVMDNGLVLIAVKVQLGFSLVVVSRLGQGSWSIQFSTIVKLA